MLIMHIIFSHRHLKITVAMVIDSDKILQKHIDPEITQKLFKLVLMKLGM